MNRIHSAIRKLDYTALLKHLPQPVAEDDAQELLALADEAAGEAILDCAGKLAKATPGRKPALTLKHSERMLAYQSIRAVICGEFISDDEDNDLGIF